MTSFFKKKASASKPNAANVHMTEAEAALAQSDFNIDKILEIQNKFTGGTALLVPGRIFIREGTLWKVCRKGPKKRQFFLFNDILVYGSVVASRYSNQHVLPLSQMQVSGDPSYQPQVNTQFDADNGDDHLDVNNAFQISHADKSFHVFSLSQADKANWLANLQKHINKVALVGGSQSVNPRPVWVPDAMSKECMVCGQRFSAFNRKHHCRQCGRVVCSACSPHRVQLEAPGEGKSERVCSGCLRSVSAIKSKATCSSEMAPKPPAGAAAAQLVSDVLRRNSDKQPTGSSPQTRRHRRDSTDTEDSDDSGKEDQQLSLAPVRTKPSPTPRRTHSESAKHSHVVATSQPSPKPRPASTAHPVPKERKRIGESTVGAVQGGGGEGVKEGGGERVKEGGEAMKGKMFQEAEEEAQPTPPPRKKKKAKLKQKLEEQLQKQLEEERVVSVREGDGQSDRTEEKGGREDKGKDEGRNEGEKKDVLGEKKQEEAEADEKTGGEGEEGESEEEGVVEEEGEVEEEGVVEEEGEVEEEREVEEESDTGTGERGGRAEEEEGEQHMSGESSHIRAEDEEEKERIEKNSDGEGGEEGRGEGEVKEDREEAEKDELIRGATLVADHTNSPDGEAASPVVGAEGPVRPRRRRKHFMEEAVTGGDGEEEMHKDAQLYTPAQGTVEPIQETQVPLHDPGKEMEQGMLDSGLPEPVTQEEGEEEVPMKKPRGRKSKFKPADS